MATRRERVVLELEDQFTGPIIKAVAATKLLKHELNDLSGNAVKSSRATRDLEGETKKLGNTAGGSSREVDRMSGRLRILADVALVTTPALSAVGSVGVAGFAGLSSEIGFAVVGVGAAVLAFHGLGDVLTKVNKAALDPTATNLENARLAMANLSPAARGFVHELQGLMPELQRLQGIAQANLFPGLTDGLRDLQTTLPAVEGILGAVSAELGRLGAEAGKSLASDKWSPFFAFIQAEAPKALADAGHAIGNVTHALAELWMAFAPLNREFGDWLVSTSRDLDRWATGLDQTQGFQEFLNYVREQGPVVAKTIGDLAIAFLKVAEAAGPLAGPVLGALDAIAKIVSTIAGSDLGTPIYAGIAALVIYNRVLNTTTKLQTAWSGGLGAAAGKIGLVTAAISAFTVLDKALNLSMDQGAISRMTSILDAQAGPNLSDQIQATKDAIAQQQQLADNANIHINLGFTDIYSSDKAAKAADAVIGLKNHLKDLTTQQEVATASAQSFTTELARENKVMVEQQQAARDVAKQFLAFGTNLDDTKVSLDQWIHSLEQQAKALHDFADNAVEAANKGLRKGLIAELEKAGPAGALRMQQLANASDSEIRRANRAWASGRRAIQEYINLTVKPKTVDVNTAPAKAKIRELIRLLAGVSGGGLTSPGPDIGPLPGVTPQHGSASGGTVPTSGQGYADRYLYMLADGEEVISNRNGQADRHRALLKAINAGGLASGGTAGLGSYIHNTLDMAYPHGLRAWNRALEESTKVVDAEKNHRQALLDQAKAVSDAIGSNYKSDLFGKSSTSVWMSAADRAKAGTGDVFSTLTGDIGNLGALKAAIAKLKSKGLSGPALADLLSNGSLSDVQGLAGDSRSDVAKYESLYNQRDRLLASVGGAGASAAFGAQLATEKRQLTELVKMRNEIAKLRHEAEAREKKREKALKHAAPKRRP